MQSKENLDSLEMKICLMREAIERKRRKGHKSVPLLEARYQEVRQALSKYKETHNDQ